MDHYSRGERLYWFVYLEDYAESQLGYDDMHQLEVQVRRPAFEIVLVYDTEECSLDTWLRGQKDRLASVQRVFANVVLGIEIGLHDPAAVVYSLQGLLSRSFPFPLEPEDGVESVQVRRLRMRVVGSGSRRITLEACADRNPDAIYDLLDDVLAGERITRDLLQMVSGSLQIAFKPKGTDKRRRKLTFSVSEPNSCSLKYEERHLVAKDLLKRWGIDVSGPSDVTAADRRRRVQRTLRI